MTDEIVCRFRAPRPTDLAFIMSSWLKSYRDEGPNRWVTHDVYHAIHRPRFTAALRERALIACSLDDDDQIFGWACAGEGNALHYVYVKRVFRRAGVAKGLVRRLADLRLPVTATHTGRIFEAQRSALGLTYDPSRLESP